MLLQDWIEVHSGPLAGQQSLFQTSRRPGDAPESCTGDAKWSGANKPFSW